MRVNITVKPGSKKGPLVQQGLRGDLLVFVREPTVDGKANAAVVKLSAERYNVTKSSVTIVKGHKSAHKICAIVLG